MEDLPRRAARLAGILGEEFHGCAQMTLKALQEVFGLTDIEVFKAASPLSGGVARSGEVCGALLGALLCVGVIFGRSRLERTDMSEDYSRSMEVATRIYDEFKDEFGTSICREIHKRLFDRVYNLRDEKDVKEFIESGAWNKCAEVMSKAAEIAARNIIKAGYKMR
ncbi:MAG: C-GCAxxG-C-C family protein [Aigarchaeota archaeon]|nr:C-GCAxxG-C-C family protein [Aigarchaeota archaeon]